MDAERLLGTLIRGALGGRRKRSRGALRFLTGGRHSLLNAGTLLAAAGVAWGLYETATQQRAASPASPPPGSGATPSGAATTAGVPPPVPPSGTDAQTSPGPAPAGFATTPSGDPASAGAVSPDVLRVIRLTIAAARADGTLTDTEQDTILAHARTVGAESLVAHELRSPTPLQAIVAGASPAQRADLYTLAFAVARADETVSGGERIFLAQLAHQLGLEAAAVTELERVAAERIAEGPASD